VCDRFDEVTYLEIGVGHGETLASMANTIRARTKPDWRAIGVELPYGYSFDAQKMEKNLNLASLRYNYNEPNDPPAWGEVTIYMQDSQDFLSDYWQEEIQLALIDGCHGKPCVTGDFLHIESFVAPGGVVLFHDFGDDQVGQSQPHCSGGLDVAGACRDLGLTNNERAGWHFMGELVGDKSTGAANMGVFQKHEV
jgi:hypothetical protein